MSTGGTADGGRLASGLRPAPSIPSKYQTYVITNNEKKGFNSRSCRFSDYDYISENPGPGSYTAGHDGTFSSGATGKTSWSKKGLGSFASSTKRFHGQKMSGSTAVGPGSYDHETPSSDFNRGVMSAFHKPICVAKRPGLTAPPPNHYNPQLPPKGVPSACASFKSRSRRDGLPPLKGSDFPAPGSYEIDDSVIKKTINPMSSVFKSKVRRSAVLDSESKVPGPGAYDPYEGQDAEGTPFYRLHYLAISAPAMPLPKPKPNPGPGHYNIVNYEGPDKTNASSANFVSSLPRGTALEPYKQVSPGPAAYKPKVSDRHSFIYNFKGRWI